MELDFKNTTYHEETGTIAPIETYVQGKLHGECPFPSRLGLNAKYK